MLAIAVLITLFVMVLGLARAFAGPGVFDRILAANLFGTKTVLFIAMSGYLFGRPDFLDIAVAYALINYISVVGVLRYFELRSEDQPEPQE